MDMYDLQARCEAIANKARRCESVERDLRRAKRCIIGLRASLTASREAIKAERDLRNCYKNIGLSYLRALIQQQSNAITKERP